jgi:hypothetical protein
MNESKRRGSVCRDHKHKSHTLQNSKRGRNNIIHLVVVLVIPKPQEKFSILFFFNRHERWRAEEHHDAQCRTTRKGIKSTPVTGIPVPYNFYD